MLRIGLTGGIGSGKSTVSAHFARLGAAVIDTDVIARAVVEPGRPGYRRIVEQFGAEILLADSGLDRAALRRLVFEQPARRRQLEAILHPLIRAEVERRVAELAAPYAIIVVPLLVETDFSELVDRVLVVDAPDDLRVAWVAQRSGMNEDEIRRIIDAQASRARRLAAADDVLVNDGSLDQLRRRVEALHARYLELARSRNRPGIRRTDD